MNTEKLFEILVKSLLNKKGFKKKDSEERLKKAGIVIDNFQMSTGPPPESKKEKKKKKIYTMKDFEYHMFMEVAQFLTYEDLYKYMRSTPSVYLILAQLNYFWENKFEREFMGFDYPKDLNMPNQYFLDVIGPIKFYKKTIQQIVWFKETPDFLRKTDWFRKTRYFLKKLKEINKRFKGIDPLTNTENIGYLNNIRPYDILYTNNSFVVGLILFFDSYHVFPYVEKNKNNINVDILVKSVEMGIYEKYFVQYTNSLTYVFDRKEFIMKIEYFDLNYFDDSYAYLKGDYEIGKKVLDINVLNILYITNERLKNDPEIALKVVKENVTYFDYLGNQIRNKSEKICEYVLLHAYKPYLHHCGPDMRNNKRIVEIASNARIENLNHASNELKNDPDFMLKVIKNTEDQLKYLKDEDFAQILIGYHVKNNPKIMFILINKNYKAYKFIGDELKKNENFIQHLTNEIPMMVAYAPDVVKNNPVIMLNLIKRDNRVYNFVGKELIKNKEFTDKAYPLYNQHFFY